MTRAAALSLWLLSAATPALAQEHHPEPLEVDEGLEQEARALFTAGRSAMSNGRFDAAVEYFERAYELSHRPELLFNIGLAADRDRQDEVALRRYRAFLEAMPDSANVAYVQRRIDAILSAPAEEPDEEEPDEQAIAEPEPVVPEPEPEPSGGGADVAAPVIVMAVGVAAAGAGLGLFFAGDADRASVENAADGSSFDDVADAYARAPDLMTAGQVLGFVGAGVAAAGLTWLVIAIAADSGSETTAVRIGPGRVTVAGAFD